jgi:hypothetical protein
MALLYTDVGPGARWRPHKRSEAEYLARVTARRLSAGRPGLRSETRAIYTTVVRRAGRDFGVYESLVYTRTCP